MAASLRDLIASRKPVVAPSIYDGISALVLKEFGFEAAYIGSYGTGATKYGLPDIGYIGVDDMADQVRRLAPVADVPIIVDGEGGWGNPLHVARSVRILERAGAAATHIEDHDFGKHITAKPRVISTKAAVDKIKSALDARASDEFMIIARTDSSGSEGPEAAVDRVLAYQEAGADGIFVAGMLDEPSRLRLNAERRVPLFNTNFPGLTNADQFASGVDVVLYYAIGHMAATQGLRNAFSTLARDDSAVALEEGFGGIAGIVGYDDFLGIPDARENAAKYGLLD
ncbi:isocitrate lyase/PEP mutase family protein [Subtercola endophyticus]|uniref:isocitrate lyase/PEP mutase family protein n=1 Tax=Subtercola endophyticus TaxID=2895559 RepID=UPI001E426520|nr:isocitrate lyase/PEP mutase family protein [Subtercola endophyticus]UFS58756.1 isocitrate lyase/PEP mutase family protein [Subtercola endophyticus]